MLVICVSEPTNDNLIGWEPAELWVAKRDMLEIRTSKTDVVHHQQLELSKLTAFAKFPSMLVISVSNMTNDNLIGWEPAELWVAKRDMLEFRT